MVRWIVLVAAVLGAAGVGIGAHAAHGLETDLEKQGLAPEAIGKRVGQCEVGVRYQMTHVLAMLVLGVMNSAQNSWHRSIAASFFLLGIGLFSGGLYSMVFLDTMGHWAIVPSGGLCFIVGWLTTATLAWNAGVHHER